MSWTKMGISHLRLFPKSSVDQAINALNQPSAMTQKADTKTARNLMVEIGQYSPKKDKEAT